MDRESQRNRLLSFILPISPACLYTTRACANRKSARALDWTLNFDRKRGGQRGTQAEVLLCNSKWALRIDHVWKKFLGRPSSLKSCCRGEALGVHIERETSPCVRIWVSPCVFRDIFNKQLFLSSFEGICAFTRELAASHGHEVADQREGSPQFNLRMGHPYFTVVQLEATCAKGPFHSMSLLCFQLWVAWRLSSILYNSLLGDREPGRDMS